VFGPDERPPARHAARPAGGRRRFLLVVAVLVALASIPSLAVVLAGAASLDATPGSRSPFVADGPDGPVRVGPDRDSSVRPGGRPPMGVEQPHAVPSPARPAGGRPVLPPGRPARRGGPMPEAGAAGGPGPRAESCTAAGPPVSSGTPTAPSTPDPTPSAPDASGSSSPVPPPAAGPAEYADAGGFGLDFGIFGVRVR
jgi:hypothetical protein